MGTPLAVNAVSSSTLIAMPTSRAKSNPFDTEPKEPKSSKKEDARKKAAAFINFKNYLKSGKLKLDECGATGDMNCKNEYVLYPNATGIEQCDDVRKSLNIPEDSGFCKETPLFMLPKRINAQDLENFVGLKKKK